MISKDCVNDAFFYWLLLRYSRKYALNILRIVNILFVNGFVTSEMFGNVARLRENMKYIIDSSDKFTYISPRTKLFQNEQIDIEKYDAFSHLYQMSYYMQIHAVNIYSEFLGNKHIVLDQMQKAVSCRGRHSVESDFLLMLFDYPNTLNILTRIAHVLNSNRKHIYEEYASRNTNDAYCFLELLLRFYVIPLSHNRIVKMKWLGSGDTEKYKAYQKDMSKYDVVLYMNITEKMVLSYNVKDDRRKLSRRVTCELPDAVAFYFNKFLIQSKNKDNEYVFATRSHDGDESIESSLGFIRTYLVKAGEDPEYLGLNNGKRYQTESSLLWVCSQMYQTTTQWDSQKLSSLLYQVGSSMAIQQFTSHYHGLEALRELQAALFVLKRELPKLSDVKARLEISIKECSKVIIDKRIIRKPNKH